jgi:hypothetical protein
MFDSAVRDGDLADRTSELLAHRQQCALYRCVNRWLHRARYDMRIRRLSEELRARTAESMRVRALRTWRRRVDQQRRRTRLLALLIARVNRRSNEQVWKQWSEVMYTRAFARFESRIAVRSAQARAIKRWCRMLEYRSALRCALGLAATGARCLLLQQAMSCWRHSLKMRRYRVVCIAWMSRLVDQRAVRRALTVVWPSHTIAKRTHDKKMMKIATAEKVRYIQKLSDV